MGVPQIKQRQETLEFMPWAFHFRVAPSPLKCLCPDTPLRCIKIVGTRTEVIKEAHWMSLIACQNIATRHFRAQRQSFLAQIGHSLL